MSYFTHVFEGPIEELVYPGAFTYRILRLPADVEAELPFTTHPRLRVTGEIAELPVSLAFNPDPGKRRYVILSTRFCRDAHIDVGDQVEFRFNIADQDAVDIPEELSALLAGELHGYCRLGGADARRAPRARLADCECKDGSNPAETRRRPGR